VLNNETGSTKKKQLSNERKLDEIIKLMKEILNNGIKISD
jgi:hypothetical protein